MLDSILQFSIRNKAIIILMTIGLVVWGGWSLTQLPIDAVPDITNNQVQVLTIAPSQSAQDIERLVTFPVEQTMTTIPGVEEIRSFSRFGLSVVTIVFREHVDPYWARQQVNERLVEAKSQIPEGVGTPTLAPMTTGLGEIFQYTLRPLPAYRDRYDAMELRTIQDWIVRRQLLGVEGVAEVSSFGGHLKQYEIALNPTRLQAMGVGISDVFDALAANNQNTGGAYIDKRPYAWYIRSEGLVESIADIEQIVVRMPPDGVPVLLRDVATVQLGHAIRYGAMTHNDDGEVVGAVVMMLKGANSSQVVSRVKARIEEIKHSLPEGVVIEPYLDRTDLVNSAIATVGKNLLEGALIVIFVLVLLLGNLRGGLIVASVIPLAMLFAVAMMNLFGVSGNLMSLGAIDFGLIVDGAVIIVEATLHHLTHRKGETRLDQPGMDRAVLDSASKIMSSAAFGEFIILIVYLPILALVGVEGKMFKPMAETVSFAILGAFILSLTYVPMISTLTLSKRIRTQPNFSDKLVGFIQSIYGPSLRLALRMRWIVVAGAAVLLVVGVGIFTLLGAEFIPALEEGDFAVEMRVLTGSSMEETVNKSQEAARVLIDNFPEVEKVVGKIGSSEVPTDPMPIENADLIVVLKDKDEWVSAHNREELAGKMQAMLQESVPGVTFGFQQPIQMRFNELMSGARQDVVIKVYGEDLDTLAKLGAEVGALVAQTPGAQDLYVEEVTNLSQIVVDYDRSQIARFGLSIADVNLALNTAFAGQSAGMVYEAERRFDMVVRLAPGSRRNIEDVRALPVETPSGQLVPLGQLAKINFKVGPNQIQRDHARRRIVVGFNVRGRDVESIVKDVQAQVSANVEFPDGYFPKYGGTFENLIAARERLSIAVPVALLLIFVLLFFTFKSLRQSLLIFSAIPLSAIGGILALWTRGMPFSISAGVGFIALFGVAVLNAIVLVAEFNRLIASGMTDLREIILQGTRTRLRPVIMTAAVASLGFLPMAISNSSGAEVQRPLATVVIGGLVTATLLTLIVLPCLFSIFQKLPKDTPPADALAPVAPEPPLTDGPSPEKGPGGIAAIAGAIMLLLLPLGLAAQQPMDLPTATRLALAHHAQMQQAGMAVAYAQALTKTVGSLPPLEVSLTAGQYNSHEWRDNNLTLGQSLPFPTVWAREKSVAQARVQQKVAEQAVTANEVVFQLHETWLQLQYLQAQAATLIRLDTIFREMIRIANARYQSGEATQLEPVGASQALNHVQAQLATNRSETAQWMARLQWMVGSAAEPAIADSFPTIVHVPGGGIEGQPALRVLDEAATLAQRERALQQHALLPGLRVGYFNQTLIGYQTVNGNEVFFGPNARFQGVTLGLTVPLWLRPELAKVEAARLAERQAVATRDLAADQWRLLLEQAQIQWTQCATELGLYESVNLPNARLLLEQSQKAYRAGEIDHTVLLYHLEQVSRTQLDHLLLQLAWHQADLRIQYIQGQFSTSN